MFGVSHMRRRPFRNVAPDGECMQSSSPDNASCAFALNNDTSTFSHTAAEDQPWFLLNLKKPHYIDSVRLWNRPGSEQHLRDFYLVVSNVSDRSRWPSRCREPSADECNLHDEDSNNEMVVRRVEGHFDRRIQVQLSAIGQYVLVRRRHTGPLDISEIEVFGEEVEQLLEAAIPAAAVLSAGLPATAAALTGAGADLSTAAIMETAMAASGYLLGGVAPPPAPSPPPPAPFGWQHGTGALPSWLPSSLEQGGGGSYGAHPHRKLSQPPPSPPPPSPSPPPGAALASRAHSLRKLSQPPSFPPPPPDPPYAPGEQRGALLEVAMLDADDGSTPTPTPLDELARELCGANVRADGSCAVPYQPFLVSAALLLLMPTLLALARRRHRRHAAAASSSHCTAAPAGCLPRTAGGLGCLGGNLGGAPRPCKDMYGRLQTSDDAEYPAAPASVLTPLKLAVPPPAAPPPPPPAGNDGAFTHATATHGEAVHSSPSAPQAHHILVGTPTPPPRVLPPRTPTPDAFCIESTGSGGSAGSSDGGSDISAAQTVHSGQLPTKRDGGGGGGNGGNGGGGSLRRGCGTMSAWVTAPGRARIEPFAWTRRLLAAGIGASGGGSASTGGRGSSGSSGSDGSPGASGPQARQLSAIERLLLSPPPAAGPASAPATPDIDVSSATTSTALLPATSASSSPASASPSVLMLFSVPLVCEAEGGLIQLEPIDLESEIVLLRRSLRESGRLVPVATEVATVDNLRSLLTRGAFSCLHFSGHGHPDALAFEDPQGAAHFISLQHLQRLICAGDSSSHVQLVFVNCCYSGVAAQHFVDAGIPHVVCSPTRLRDAAAAAFTRGLYMALAVGKTVAQAFAIAQECVRCAPRMPAGEADKFVLLPEGAAHDEVLWDAPRAPTPRAPPPPPPVPPPLRLGLSALPYPPEDFGGRAVDLHRLLGALRRRRLVLLTAAPPPPSPSTLPPTTPMAPVRGMGLSTVAAALARHQDMRRSHADGVAYVRAPDRGGMAALCSALEAELSMSGGANSADAGAASGDGAGVGGGGVCGVGGGASAAEESAGVAVAVAARAEALVEALREREGLLVLDGVEALLALDASFARFLHALLSRSLHLRLLLTSSAPLPPHLDLPAKVVTYQLAGLAPLDAARLLARRVGRPLPELLPPRPPAAPPAPPPGVVVANPLAVQAAAAQPTLETLAAEPLLLALGGRPAAIVKVAAAITGRPAGLSVRAAFEANVHL